MPAVYFDTSVFLAVIARQPKAQQVRALLPELKADKIRIYTSILTVQEVSVSSFLHGSVFGDYHTKISRLARIKGVTKEIALTAAKFEAAIVAHAKKGKPRAEQQRINDNRRRKFDCFHLATALALGCSTFYAFDDKFEGRCVSLDLPMRVLEPSARKPGLPFTLPAPVIGPSTPTA